MRVFIPTIGDTLKLEADWTFRLFHEDRNVTLFGHLGIPIPPRDLSWRAQTGLQHTMVTLKAGTELSIDRIYIRRGKDEFDSITFNLLGAKTQPTRWGSKTRVRFWVKLDDVNKMDAEYVLTHQRIEV